MGWGLLDEAWAGPAPEGWRRGPWGSGGSSGCGEQSESYRGTELAGGRQVGLRGW